MAKPVIVALRRRAFGVMERERLVNDALLHGFDVLLGRQMTKARFYFVIPIWRCLFDIDNFPNLKISHDEAYSSRC